jgi:hypothetical protein
MKLLSYRIGGIRLFDTIIALIILWVIIFMIQWKRGRVEARYAIATSLGLSLIVLFPLAIIIHALFGVTTFLNCRLRLASYDKCVLKGF